jgi:23S rRNA (uracil1939-C5)-methyltransferase
LSKIYNTGEIIDVRIEKIVPRGLGLGFAEDLTVLVPLSAPDDILRVRIDEIKKKLAFASIIEIKDPGPDRTAPPCEYFGICGGCDFQQMSYDAQLEAKVGIIRDCLNRITKIEFEAEIPIIASPLEFGYRSRVRWHLDREKQATGYFRRDSHEVINIRECPIITPGLQAKLNSLGNSIDWASIGSEGAELEAATGGDGEVSINCDKMAEPATDLSFGSDGVSYAFSAATFFQANTSLVPKLIEAAVGDTRGNEAFDLYCGVGLFTLPLAKRFASVTGVEGNHLAMEFARKNCRGAGLSNVRLVSKGVSKFLAENQKKKIDLVLIDPPRSGTEKGTIPAIAGLDADQISYVSCEPSILARDLRIFLDTGFRIASITALDLFPQTHHVETVVRLSRAKARG